MINNLLYEINYCFNPVKSLLEGLFVKLEMLSVRANATWCGINAVTIATTTTWTVSTTVLLILTRRVSTAVPAQMPLVHHVNRTDR